MTSGVRAFPEQSPSAPADQAEPRAVTASRPPGALASLLRAAVAPVLAAAVLVGLLAVWTVTGGAGTLRKVHVEVTLAAIPLSFRPGAGNALRDATTYLDIKNVGTSDFLVGARSPKASRVIIVRDGRIPLARGRQLRAIPIAGGGSLDLSPFGADVVLIHPQPLHIGETVPITLDFRYAGRVLIDLVVTASLANPSGH